MPIMKLRGIHYFSYIFASYFQKEAIWTMDSKGELRITIMSSLRDGRFG